VQSTEEEVVHQISVLHEDNFVRTYTVSEAEFLLLAPDCDLDTLEPDPKRAQCYLESYGEKLTKKIIEEVAPLAFCVTFCACALQLPASAAENAPLLALTTPCCYYRE
jgi:hypothetical protein